jgi:hypothetical protein
MQTKLFELFEGGSGGNAGARISHVAADSDHQDGAGAVMVRSSSGATCGTQRSESWIRDGLAAINFCDLVRDSSGCLVLPIDPGSKEDIFLLKRLSQALTAEEFTQTPPQASVLDGPGYPDCVLEHGERVTYLEIKTSASIQKEADKYLKTFSSSSGKKIKSDARHLLLKVQLVEEDDKIWKVVAWELSDLSTLKTRLKTEFNPGFGDLADVRLLGSSDNAARALTVSGQSFLNEPVAAASEAKRRRRRSEGRMHLPS